MWYKTEPIEQQHQCRQHLGNEGHLLDLLQHHLDRAGEGKLQHIKQPPTSLATKNLVGIKYGILATFWDCLSGIHSSLTTARPWNLCCILELSRRRWFGCVSGWMKLIYRVFPIQHKQWKQAQKKIWSFVSSVLLREWEATLHYGLATTRNYCCMDTSSRYSWTPWPCCVCCQPVFCTFVTTHIVIPLCRPMKVLATHQSLDSLTSPAVRNGQLHKTIIYDTDSTSHILYSCTHTKQDNYT